MLHMLAFQVNVTEFTKLIHTNRQKTVKIVNFSWAQIDMAALNFC